MGTKLYSLILVIFLFLPISVIGSINIFILERNFKTQEDTFRSWTTHTTITIIEGSNGNDPIARFYCEVDDPMTTHTITIDPSGWAHMENKLSPKIGINAILKDSSEVEINRILIPYDSWTAKNLIFTPTEVGTFIFELQVEYGISNDWDSSGSWELGDVKVDFFHFKQIYWYLYEFDNSLRRFRNTANDHDFYLLSQDLSMSTIVFKYWGNWEDDYSPLEDIKIFDMDNTELVFYNLTSRITGYIQSLDISNVKSDLRIHINEKNFDHEGMGYLFTFVDSSNNHLPIYLSNNENESPKILKKYIIDNFESRAPFFTNGGCTATCKVVQDIKINGYASNYINFTFNKPTGEWFYFHWVYLNNPFDFSLLEYLSFWVYTEKNLYLHFYGYFRNFDNNGVTLAEVRWDVYLTCSDWTKIALAKSDFVLVMGNSFNFSKVNNIEIGIDNTAYGEGSDQIYFDYFLVKVLTNQDTSTQSTPSTTTENIESSLTSTTDDKTFHPELLYDTSVSLWSFILPLILVFMFYNKYKKRKFLD